MCESRGEAGGEENRGATGVVRRGEENRRLVRWCVQGRATRALLANSELNLLQVSFHILNDVNMVVVW